MMDLETADRARDRRLRKKLLSTLHLSRAMSPKGGLSGRTWADLVHGSSPSGQSFEDDGHALGLMRDLAAKGLVMEESLPRRRGQAFGLDYVFFKVTDRGSSLVNESIEPDPDIDDDRVAED